MTLTRTQSFRKQKNDMKTLVVYYSHTENNAKLANYLQQQLHCDIVKIETVRKRNGFSIFLDLMFSRNPEIKPVPYYLRDYDHIIFVAPIWAGKVAMPMKTFLLQEKENIRQYSFLTLCGGGNPDQKTKIGKEMLALTGKAPDKLIELWINDLLPAEEKNTIRDTTRYKVAPTELRQFNRQISELMSTAGFAFTLSGEPVA